MLGRQPPTPDRQLSELGSENAAHEPLLTFGDCISSAEELQVAAILLGRQQYHHPTANGIANQSGSMLSFDTVGEIQPAT